MRIIDCFEKGAALDPQAPMFIDGSGCKVSVVRSGVPK